MHGWIKFFKDNLGKFFIVGFLLIIWQTLQISSSALSPVDISNMRPVEAIRREAKSIIKPGDVVFLSTQNKIIQQTIDQSGASVHKFDSTDETGFNAALQQVLDEYCNQDQKQDKPAIYFIWSNDNKLSAMELSQAARGLNFFFSFQAVLPYKGSDAFAIDKFLRLQPKENIIRRYCEVKRLAGTRQVLLTIDASEFSPWIGSVVTGNITWLANDPIRKMTNSDYAVKDMPPLVTFDVYWMSQLYSNFYWSFENQDLAAYDLAVGQAKAENYLVLVDRHAKLGITALRYLKECDHDQSIPQSQLFRQICIK
ncbi:MAG: hypothetical protein EHM20_08240 [Alphaproteobacteria bacterium]|nr:MAG: hypothetical protein EHM20_08240 [Alphaproteobacteria bacterium]